MSAYEHILDKLLRFTRKYYTKTLIRGILLFAAFGVLFFLLTLSVEYFLWLNSNGRLILLLGFLIIEAFLFYRFILIPVTYLLKIRKGISEKEASLIIGKHFPEVSDRLYNLLDLAEDKRETELLLASIEQRSRQLEEVPFHKAIDLRENLKYARYIIIPIVILAGIWISGNLSTFFSSYDRVVNYEVAYEPPAPFQFKLLTGDLSVLETEELEISLATEGDVQPEDVHIVIDGRKYLMQRAGNMFIYTFAPPLVSTEIYFEANDIRSANYYLEALKVPAIQDFKLRLEYPAYTEKQDEILNSTGNAVFPEGTKVSWEIRSINTEAIELVADDTTVVFTEIDNVFSLDKRIMSDLDYEITTSNSDAANYESLQYKFKVVKDNAPRIRVREILDSVQPNIKYYEGEASDDYKLTSLRLVCYPSGKESDSQVLVLDRPLNNFKQFYYTFPSGLNLEEGRNYDYYFEVVDNDALRGGKASRTEVFSTRVMNQNELGNKQLDFQKEIIDDFDRSVENYKKQEKSLREINQDQKEKNRLDFNDQNKIKEFLDKQEQQEKMMQKFSKQLKENLEQKDDSDQLNKLLKERLERQELEARKNEKLLEELKKVADKLEKEDLNKRLEELGKSQKNSERNLEQLLELTKRYYVTEKASQLSKDLEELAEKQKALSEKPSDSTTVDQQSELNKEFDELAKELDTLLKDNEKLKKPLPLKVSEEKKEGAQKDQQDALEELNNEKEQKEGGMEEEGEESKSNAAKKQRSASEKMQQMSQDLRESSSQMGGGSTITEDAEMLRQILDNLITFSFKQETLFEQLESKDLDISYFSEVVKEQNELSELFEHVDDSLFALSLRRAELSEFVNEQINEVYYNMDKSVESIVEGRIYQGVSYQQYVLTAANNLADFLADILDNMQQSMKSGSSSGGQGGDFQLPDIIRSQQQLGEKMGQMSGKGKSGKEGNENDGEGEDSKEGEQGEESKGAQEKGGEEEGKQGQKGNKEGEGGGDNQGDQQGMGSEEDLQEIYEIYKEQQRIREMLEKQLEDMIQGRDKQLAQRILRQMEEFENELLRSGVTERTVNRLNTIQHQLLRLKNAAMTQGEKQERQSDTNRKEFDNPITTKPKALDDLKNDIEILNRQALPLHQIYQEKVKDYFDSND